MVSDQWLGAASPLSEQMPSRMPWEVFGNKSSNPSIADILAGVDQKRFGGLGFDTQMKILNPMYEEQQQKAQRAKVQQWLDGFSSYSQGDTGDTGDIMNLFAKLFEGSALGVVDSAGMGHVISGANNRYEHNNPHQKLETVDTGDMMTGYRFDPRTGSAVEAFRRQIGLNPTTRYTTDVNAATSRYTAGLSI